ncbi:SGK3 kinase, partial [Pygoscelis papua]
KRTHTMDLKESCPSVSIPSSDEHREKKKRFTVYKVLVSVGRNEWFVFRRYAEFDKLYNTLKKQFPTMNLKIPAKRIFGDNFDPDFIKQRRAGLNEFIQNLVRQPELCNHPDVRAFLQMDNPKHQSDPSEDEDERSSRKLNSTSQNINLGPSGNPHAKPTDFDFLKVIGKGSFGKVSFLITVSSPGARMLAGVLCIVTISCKADGNQLALTFSVRWYWMFITDQSSDTCLTRMSNLATHNSCPHRDLQFEAELRSSFIFMYWVESIQAENGRVGTASSLLRDVAAATYLAPEVIKKQPYDNTVDWWCLGAVLYEMLYGLPPFYCRDVAEMYENILHKPLVLRPGISLTAWSILEELLEKDRQSRLGAREDFLEIQKHPFFESLSWTDLLQKKIPPPFNPNVVGPDDIGNFDAVFTEEMVPYSVCVSSDYNIVNASVLEADDAFVGFSYAPPSEDMFS